MRTITLAAAVLMCSASALAQTTATTTAPNTSATPDASVTTDTGATITTADPSATTSTATGATTAAPATGASTSVQTSSTGGVDIAAHDSDQDGSLTPLEFAEHVSAMTGDASLTAEARRERYSRASGNGAIKLLNRTADEFGAADRNRDKRVDSTELAMWQSGGMSASASTTPSAPITSGAGTMSPVPDTSATMNPSTVTDTPSDPALPEAPEMTDDLPNSTDPNGSTTTPPPTD